MSRTEIQTDPKDPSKVVVISQIEFVEPEVVISTLNIDQKLIDSKNSPDKKTQS